MNTPERTNGPPATWQHRQLYDRVVDTLHALPSRFRTSLRIAGISATDLFTLNTPLGAAIESSVVENLNDLRELWDPEGKYELYSFVSVRSKKERVISAGYDSVGFLRFDGDHDGLDRNHSPAL